MWSWTGGFWWPGFVLMAAFMVISMVTMFRLMRGAGRCGLARWFPPRDDPDVNQRTRRERVRTDVGSPAGGR